MAALSEFLTGIANAIRTKKGSSGVIPAPRFAEEILGIQTGADTSDATAQAGDLLAGKTAYGAAGKLTGTIPSKSASDLTASGANVAVPAGYYPAQVSKAVATATQATPGISVSTSGLITASATQGAGYVPAGTQQATRQLTTQGAQTITPGTSNKTIASGRYLTGTQTIKGDANLLPANIKKGVSIFGVAGTMESGKTIVTEKISTFDVVSSTQISFRVAHTVKGVYAFCIDVYSSSLGYNIKVVLPTESGATTCGFMEGKRDTNIRKAQQAPPTYSGNKITISSSTVTVINDVLDSATEYSGYVVYAY